MLMIKTDVPSLKQIDIHNPKDINTKSEKAIMDEYK